jgi:hypothetical protein
MGISAHPISVSFRVIGSDARIMTLPTALALPAEAGWEPKRIGRSTDDSGSPLITAGMILIESTDDRARACDHISKWLKTNCELIRSLNTEYKCIQVDCFIDQQAYDGFVFTPDMMECAIQADCCLSTTTYRIVRE